MQGKKEPKTIDDWMHYAKELKLRIRKLEKKQADLVLKLSEPAYASSANQSREKIVNFAISINRSAIKIQKVWRGYHQRQIFKNELRRLANSGNISSGTNKSSKTNSNEVVIKEIFDASRKMGLNLEMLYRACDKESKGSVHLDDFKQFLRRLNFKVPLSKINRFLLMLDEECTGIIHRDEYFEALSAFGVNTERDHEKDNARTYEQECLLRFSGSLKKQGITPEEVCNFCDNTNAPTIRGIKLAKFAANMSDGFYEKEIKGLRTYFDGDNTGFIEKVFFVQQIKKAQGLIDKEPSLGTRLKSPEKRTDLKASLGASAKSFKTTFSVEHEEEGDQAFNPSLVSQGRKSNFATKSSPKKPQPKAQESQEEEEEEYTPPPKKTNVVSKAPAKKETKQPVRKQEESEEEEDNRAQQQPKKSNVVAKPPSKKEAKQPIRKQEEEEDEDEEADQKQKGAQTNPTRGTRIKPQEQAEAPVRNVRGVSPSMTDLANVKRIIVKMELESMPIHEFLFNLLLKMKDVKKGVAITELTQMIDKQYAKVITAQEKTLLMKNIDVNANAPIDINGVKNFTLKLAKCSKESVWSVKLITILLARMLELQGISTGKFLLSHEINPRGNCPLEEFITKIGAVFEIEQDDGGEIFHDLDFQNTGACDVKTFVKAVDSYRSDLAKYKGEDLGSTQGSKNQKQPVRRQEESEEEEDNRAQQQPKKSNVVAKPPSKKEAKQPIRKQEEEEDEDEEADQKQKGAQTNPTRGTRIKPQEQAKAPVKNIRDASPSMTDLANVKRIIVKMELESMPIHEFLFNLLLKMKDVNKGVAITELTQMIDKQYTKVITTQEKILLMKNIDANANATIDINEVKNFTLKLAKCSKERVFSVKLITILLARMLELQGISTGKFFLSHEINPRGNCPLEEFITKIGAVFEIEHDDGGEIFHDLDFQNTGACDVKTFVKAVDSYRSDLAKYKGEDLGSTQGSSNQKQPTKAQATQKKNAPDEEEPEELEEQEEEEEKPKSRTGSRTNSRKQTEIDSKEKTEIKLIRKIISLMELAYKPISVLFETILREMKDPRVGVSIGVVRKKLDSEWESALSGPERAALIKALDADRSMFISPSDLKAFILKWAKASKEKILSLTSVLMLIAKNLHVDGISTEQFLTSIGLNPTKPKIAITSLADCVDDYLEMPADHAVEIFHELDKGSGTVDTQLLITRIDGYRVGDGDQTDTVAIKRQKEDFAVESLKAAIRAAGIEPMSIFAKSCKPGQDYTTVDSIASTLNKTIPTFPKPELTKVMQIIDADKNGFVNRDEFRMLFLDSIAVKQLAENPVQKSSTQAVSADDPIILKFIEGLQATKMRPEQFFKLADPNGDGEISLVEIKNIIKKELPKLDMSVVDIAKLLKKIDSSGNGLIEENEFLKAIQAEDYKKISDRQPIRQASSRQGSNALRAGASVTDAGVQKEAERLFDELMSKYEIKDQDYFSFGDKKWGTIFNNQMAALKYCHEQVKRLESEGTRFWDDPDFGPTESDERGKASIYYDEQPPGYPDPEIIQWCRPQEISTNKPPEFIDDGANSNDVIQGQIGDCWLIGGISVLATNDVYIRGNFNPTPEHCMEITDEEADGMTKGIYPPIFHFLRRYGIFVFKLFKNYTWRYIVIDDKLPCDKQEECPPLLVFGRCKNTNEFWVPLIEKAYAKIHNCYEALIAGYLDDALTDMTGLVSEKIKIQGANGFPAPGIENADNFWQKLKEYHSSGTMLGCSVTGQEGEVEHEVEIDGEGVGILKNHAYSIIDVIEVPNEESKKAHKTHRLLRIRNPWGNKEWTQKWSDGSPKLMKNIKKLSQAIKQRADHQDMEEFDPEANDGTFLMCFKDWRNIYHNLFASIKFPEAWSGIRFTDQWNQKNSGGVPLRQNAQAAEQWGKNPQFIMNLTNKGSTKLFVSLGQPDGRLLHGLKFPFKENIHPVCFAICKLDSDESKMTKFDAKKIVKLSILKEYREISMELDLPPGKYAIVPSTQEAGQFGQFYLNIYYECAKNKISIIKADSNLKGEVIAEEEETVSHFDDNIKKILKLKANAVIFSDDEGIMGAVKIGPKVVTGTVSKDKNKSGIMTLSELKSGGKTISRTGKMSSLNKTTSDVKKVQVNLAEGQKKFEDFLKGIKLGEADYFMGRKTILNSLNAALKVANDIVSKLKASGKTKWDDPDFGAKSEDDHAIESIYFEDPPPGYPNPDEIFWCRPEEISTEKPPTFLDEGASSGDVLQGALGDCWFIGALAIIGAHDFYLRGAFDPSPEALEEISDKEATGMTSGIYPPVFHYLRENGIYVIRFFKDYNWRYVLIDDKLPCYKQEGCLPQLVFAKCRNEDEFWVPLVEKAYAKLYNCYEALISGYIDDALNDMTGHVNRKMKIQGPKGFPSSDAVEAEAFWQVIKGYVESDTLLGCSVQGNPGETEHEVEIDGEPKGILKSHAYSIIDVVETPNIAAKNKHKTHRLLRVRNPWGNTEWNGDWSDGSTKLMNNIEKVNAEIKNKLSLTEDYEAFDPECNDGTFLINFENWRNIYSNLYCCIDFQNEWSGIRIFDSWDKDSAGGVPMQATAQAVASWAKNPQYKLVIDNKNKKMKTTHLFISLGQKDGRLIRGMKFPFKDNIHPACFALIKLGPNETKATSLDPKKAKLSQLKEYRETSLDCEVDNGTYVIVPSTQEAGQLGEFFLNVYFNCEKNDFKLDRLNGKIKWEYIAEEEEDVTQKFSDELKVFLKAK